MSDPSKEIDDKNRLKWNRILSKGVTETIREQPDMFLRRVRRGIPEDYRYVKIRISPMHISFIGGKFGRHASRPTNGGYMVFSRNLPSLRTVGRL